MNELSKSSAEATEAARMQIIQGNVNQLSSEKLKDVLLKKTVTAGQELEYGRKLMERSVGACVDQNTGKIITLADKVIGVEDLPSNAIDVRIKFGLLMSDTAGTYSNLNYVSGFTGIMTEQVKSVLNESGRYYNINLASSYEELYVALELAGAIPDGQGDILTFRGLIAIIEGVRTGAKTIDEIPNVYNLPNKVKELLLKESNQT